MKLWYKLLSPGKATMNCQAPPPKKTSGKALSFHLVARCPRHEYPLFPPVAVPFSLSDSIGAPGRTHRGVRLRFLFQEPVSPVAGSAVLPLAHLSRARSLAGKTRDPCR